MDVLRGSFGCHWLCGPCSCFAFAGFCCLFLFLPCSSLQFLESFGPCLGVPLASTHTSVDTPPCWGLVMVPASNWLALCLWSRCHLRLFEFVSVYFLFGVPLPKWMCQPFWINIESAGNMFSSPHYYHRGDETTPKRTSATLYIDLFGPYCQ